MKCRDCGARVYLLRFSHADWYAHGWVAQTNRLPCSRTLYAKTWLEVPL